MKEMKIEKINDAEDKQKMYCKPPCQRKAVKKYLSSASGCRRSCATLICCRSNLDLTGRDAIEPQVHGRNRRGCACNGVLLRSHRPAQDKFLGAEVSCAQLRGGKLDRRVSFIQPNLRHAITTCRLAKKDFKPRQNITTYYEYQRVRKYQTTK